MYLQIYISIWLGLILIVLLTRNINYKRKFIAKIRYVIYMLSWFMFMPVSVFLHPTLIYWLSPFIRKKQGKGFWIILWVFINKGKDTEEFGISNKDGAPDWYLKKHGKFKLSDTLTFGQKWWWSWRWNTRNHTDNYLNDIIGLTSNDVAWIEKDKWFEQNGKLYFIIRGQFWKFTYKIGANKFRYSLNFKTTKNKK